MQWVCRCAVLASVVSGALALACYNCSATHTNGNHCAGAFAPPYNNFNSSRSYIINCTGDYAMCFVRSWRARAKHAWIVQRGCYLSTKDDNIPPAVNDPIRAMSCTRQRLCEAEYNVCLCQDDLCNSAMPTSVPSLLQCRLYFSSILLCMFLNLFSHNL